MIADLRRSRSLVGIATMAAIGLMAVASSAADDPWSRLRTAVDFPTEPCNAHPFISQASTRMASGALTRAEVEAGADIPEYAQAAACGGVDRPSSGLDPENFANLDQHVPYLLAHMSFARGLAARISHSVSPADRWREIRTTVIVSLHLYDHSDLLIERLIAIAMLRLALQESLRHSLPEVAANEALFQQLLRMCQAERREVEEVQFAVRARTFYQALPGADPDKVAYDLLASMRSVLRYQDQPLGFDLFYQVVHQVVRADDERSWRILEAGLPALTDSKNRILRDTVTRFLGRDPAEARRLLRASPLQ